MLKPFTNYGLVRRRGEVPEGNASCRTSSDPKQRRLYKPPACGWADFSPCGAYRYTLGRDYDPQWRVSEVTYRPGYLVWLLLNPSEACESCDDNTTHLCFVRSRSMLIGYHDDRSEMRIGWDQVIVLNLFAYIATIRQDMTRHAEPVGPFNDVVLGEVIAGADMVMLGYGCDGRHQDRDVEVLTKLRTRWWVEQGQPRNLYCLGLNPPRARDPIQRASSSHPLYQSYDKRAMRLRLEFDERHWITGCEVPPR
jgi:hypothetical protein